MVEEDESWKTADPYAFLPDPKHNTDVHEELTLSDGTTERFCNTQDQLKQHLSATGGSVRLRFPPPPPASPRGGAAPPPPRRARTEPPSVPPSAPVGLAVAVYLGSCAPRLAVLCVS